ncbi:hypothetical protein ACIHCQ_28835 [Streptomyces sp. NPDC052236]|uniref:hypothetical protein n=1 Tax=Streptomyces sp. NPDC052236 TaxID=3365686 RepID=UPI0037D20B75
MHGAVRGDGEQGRALLLGQPWRRGDDGPDGRDAGRAVGGHREFRMDPQSEPAKDDLVEQVQDVITVGDFYEHAAGGQIIHSVGGRPHAAGIGPPSAVLPDQPADERPCDAGHHSADCRAGDLDAFLAGQTSPGHGALLG